MKKIKDLKASFEGRIIPINGCLEEYAKQKGNLRRIGRIVADLDIFIGSTAINRNMTLVTRNTKDFSNMTGINLENWIDKS